MSERYRQSASFESATVEAVGVGNGAIAIGSGGHIEIVTADGRAGIDHGEPIVDIAFSERVIVLSPGQLTTYSQDGERIWSQPVDDAHAIAAITEVGLCGVLGPNRLRGIDVASGQQRFDVERTRPGDRDDELVATPAGFVLATWTFLTHITLDGEISFDSDLSAVVRSIGCCGDTLVVALQSDQLVGLDAAMGELEWRTELEAVQVAPVGGETILVSTTSGPRRVSPDGTTEGVEELSSGNIYAAVDDSVVCLVRDGTISTYVPDRKRLDAELLTESVGVGGTINVEATNATSDEQTASVVAEVEGCSLSPGDRMVDLDQGESEIIDFAIGEVRSEGTAEIELSVGGSIVERGTIAVEDAAIGSLAIETEMTPIRIEEGTVVLEVVVENVGGVPVESVSLLETGTSTDEIGPGETWTVEVDRPFQPGKLVSVGLAVSRGDRQREFAPTCTLPSAPSIDIDASGETVRATVVVEDGVTVSDRLVIELPGAGRVREPVTIDSDQLLLVVPQYEPGTARIGFSSIDVDERVRIRDTGPFSMPSETNRTDRTGHHNETRETTSRDRGDRPNENESSSEVGSPSRTDTDRSTGDDGSTGGTASDQPSISVTRDVEAPSPVVGRVVRDHITVKNDGSPVEVTVVGGDDRVDIGVDSGGSETVSRAVSSVSGDQIHLPAIEIEADGSVVESLPSRRIDIDEGGLSVVAAINRGDGTLTVEIENGNDWDCELLGVEIDACGFRESIDRRLGAGESVVLTRGPVTGLPNRDALVLSLTVRNEHDGTESIETLAAVAEHDADDDGGAKSQLASWIGEETKAAGEYGSAVLVFENEGDRAVSDLSVAAEGSSINELFYSEARRDSLAPGDWIEHFVDLDADAREPSFEATVSYAVDGVEHEFTVRASGPAIDEESEWQSEHLDAWSIEQVDEPTTTSAVPELPSSLSTSFDE